MFSLKRPVSACFTAILLLLTSLLLPAQSKPVDLNRKAYYTAFASNDIDAIQKQLDVIVQSSSGQKDAFEGALMMKKAGLLKGASHKLKAFKAGREKLENMITKYTGNAEFRFLRLMIQEKAPKILGYDQHLEEDHQYIVAHFRSVPGSVQEAILNYSKSSRILSPEDF